MKDSKRIESIKIRERIATKYNNDHLFSVFNFIDLVSGIYSEKLKHIRHNLYFLEKKKIINIAGEITRPNFGKTSKLYKLNQNVIMPSVRKSPSYTTTVKEECNDLNNILFKIVQNRRNKKE